jgi:pimeloyl-ACP methyl ester carboxylesterase
MRSFATRHIRLYVRETGPHANPASLGLHGSSLSGRMWEPQLEHLPDFHCLAPDLPGHGQHAFILVVSTILGRSK